MSAPSPTSIRILTAPKTAWAGAKVYSSWKVSEQYTNNNRGRHTLPAEEETASTILWIGRRFLPIADLIVSNLLPSWRRNEKLDCFVSIEPNISSRLWTLGKEVISMLFELFPYSANASFHNLLETTSSRTTELFSAALTLMSARTVISPKEKPLLTSDTVLCYGNETQSWSVQPDSWSVFIYWYKQILHYHSWRVYLNAWYH